MGKRNLKKKWTVLAGVLLAVTAAVTLTGCGNVLSKGEKAANAEKADTTYEKRVSFCVYDVVATIEEGETEAEKEALRNLGGNGADFPLAAADVLGGAGDVSRELVVKDVATLTLDVTYVGAEREGIVTSKWMYYYAALGYITGLEHPQNGKPQGLPSDGESFFYKKPIGLIPYENAEAVLEDEYCMEQVAIDVGALKAFDGKSLREMTAAEVEEAASDDRAIKEQIRANEILSGFYEEVKVAALARYGAFDVAAASKPVGYLYIDGKWVSVVGYYETEADKLLSSGVSMDENSDEYKLVLAQLKNTVVYSTMGDFIG